MLKKLALAATFALLSSASADRIGVFLPGVQYVQDLDRQNALRYSVSVPLFLNSNGTNGLLIGGDVSYLRSFNPRTGAGFEPYAGVNLGLVYASSLSATTNVGGFIVAPGAFIGTDYHFNSRWSLFLEGGVVGLFGVATTANTTVEINPPVAPALRLGVNYRF